MTILLLQFLTQFYIYHHLMQNKLTNAITRIDAKVIKVITMPHDIDINDQKYNIQIIKINRAVVVVEHVAHSELQRAKV